MGIKFCLGLLRDSFRRLRALDNLANEYNNADLRKLVNEVAANSEIVILMVQKLGVIYSSKPLEFKQHDMYSKCPASAPITCISSDSNTSAR